MAAFMAASAALAFTPEDVLARTPESERTLRQAAAVTAAERALAASRAGTDVGLALKPELSYGADVEDPAAFGAALDLELDLAWRHDRAAVLADTIDLLYARERLRHWRRSDVRDALRLHARVLRAEVALRRAELDLERARGAGAARTEAVVEARRHALDALRAEAAQLGFTGRARFEPLRFTLPELGATPARRRRLQLELERAALMRDALPYDVLRDVSLDATYESSTYGYQLGASLSLDRGRPGAALNGQLGSQQDDQWSVSLSARILLDGADERARADADERVRRARAALDALDRESPDDARRARLAVEDATALLEVELNAWRAAADSAPSRSACRALLARENAVYGAWLGVVGAVYEVLEQLDGAWRADTGRLPPEDAPASRGEVTVSAGRGPVPASTGRMDPGLTEVRASVCRTGAP
ncbi:MAG: hypothetical protein P8Y05_06440 [Deinococcales bacterium]